MSHFDYRDTVEFYDEMIELGKRGLTIEECGQYHGVDDETWAEWCRDHPLTEVKLQRGKAQGLAIAGRELLNQIEAGKINAIMFYLKTQGNFAERTASQLEEAIVSHTMPTVPSDPTEAANVYRQFMKDS